jgi:predicted secreted protein
VVGVLVLACCGCQKGSERAGAGSPDMSEAAKANLNSGQSKTKSSKMKSEHAAEKREAKAPASHEQHKAAAKEKEQHPAMHKVAAGTLTADDNGMDFNFRPGQVITVVLDSNHSSGLGWVMVEPAGSVIVLDGNPAYAVRAGKNAGGSETWRFRAAKAGHQTVRLEYRRKWASSVPERTFRFTGDVG